MIVNCFFFLFYFYFTFNEYLTLRLFALDFYEVIVDEAEGLPKFNSNNDFQLFLEVLLNFGP